MANCLYCGKSTEICINCTCLIEDKTNPCPIPGTFRMINTKGIDTKIELRPVVEWFAKEMEKKLLENDYKSGWKDSDLNYFINEIGLRNKKIYESLANIENPGFFGEINRYEYIIKECANISNFAMMIADKFGKDFGK